MGKKEIVKYIIEEYGVTTPADITNALKDLLGETLQEMMDSEFEAHMGYKKHEQKTGYFLSLSTNSTTTLYRSFDKKFM